jgi:fermentation-respiration switch protein FrsA (DUF1100 family)
MFIVTLFITLVIILAVYLAISAYIAYRIMRVPRTPLNETPASIGLSYEDVSFPSRIDNLMLKGWYLAGDKKFTIIVVTGMYQNRVDVSIGTLSMARDLVRKGYNILLFDLRGRGESEGKGVLLTNADRDIGGAFDYIRKRGCPADNIGIIGFSAGAASTIMFAGQENTAVVVIESCFANIADTFIRKAASKFNKPRLLIKVFAFGIYLMSRVIYGYRRVNPIDRVADVTCPILLIQGEKDDLIPPEDAYKLLKVSGNPSDELWLVPDTGHTETYCLNPIGYIDKVTSFLQRVEQRMI